MSNNNNLKEKILAEGINLRNPQILQGMSNYDKDLCQLRANAWNSVCENTDIRMVFNPGSIKPEWLINYENEQKSLQTQKSNENFMRGKKYNKWS